MSTTLLPFLYQTRTLQQISRAGISTPVLKRFHGNYRGVKPIPRVRKWNRNMYNSDVEAATGESIPFQLPEGYERLPPREVSHLLTEAGDRTTITSAEKEAFKAIFEELEQKRARRAQHKDVQKIGRAIAEKKSAVLGTPQEWPIDTAKAQASSEDGSVEDKINIIIQDAAEVHHKSRRHLRQPYGDGHALGQTMQAKEWDKALLRFPPSLRNAARRALGFIEEGKVSEKNASLQSAPTDFLESATQQRLSAEIDFALNPLAKSVEHESLRRAEQKRIEKLMQAAKTDFELWDVLEKEVFTLVDKLGLTPKPTTNSLERNKNKRTRKPKAEVEREPAVEDEAKLPIHIYGPLFPRLLLTALRMLDQNFAHTSPLALNVLPRIKQTGHAGYVLGASATFYNALARIEWYRYGNPDKVFNLFEEMRHAGLLCDADSQAIQLSIENWFWDSRKDEEDKNPFLKEIVSLPEWEFTLLPRIQHWATTISLQMKEHRNSIRI